MSSKPPVLHNAITFEKAKDMLADGHILEFGRLQQYLLDDRVVLRIQNKDTEEHLYVVEVADDMPLKRMKLVQAIDLLFQYQPDWTSVKAPLIQDFFGMDITYTP